MEQFLPGNGPNWFPLCLCLSCAFICYMEERKRARESRRKKERPSEVILRDCKPKPKGSFCRRSVCRANPSPQTELHQGEHLHCSVLYSVLPACSPACLPDCSNIWQRSKWIQKEHLHSSKQPSKQTLLMKVVTVPKYKATLLTTYFPLIKNILSIGTDFFPAHWGTLQQLKRQLSCVSCCVIYNTNVVQGYAVIYGNTVHFYCPTGKSISKVSTWNKAQYSE